MIEVIKFRDQYHCQQVTIAPLYLLLFLSFLPFCFVCFQNKYSETENKTFFWDPIFRNRTWGTHRLTKVSKPKCHTLLHPHQHAFSVGWKFDAAHVVEIFFEENNIWWIAWQKSWRIVVVWQWCPAAFLRLFCCFDINTRGVRRDWMPFRNNLDIHLFFQEDYWERWRTSLYTPSGISQLSQLRIYHPWWGSSGLTYNK